MHREMNGTAKDRSERKHRSTAVVVVVVVVVVKKLTRSRR